MELISKYILVERLRNSLITKVLAQYLRSIYFNLFTLYYSNLICYLLDKNFVQRRQYFVESRHVHARIEHGAEEGV